MIPWFACRMFIARTTATSNHWLLRKFRKGTGFVSSFSVLFLPLLFPYQEIKAFCGSGKTEKLNHNQNLNLCFLKLLRFCLLCPSTLKFEFDYPHCLHLFYTSFFFLLGSTYWWNTRQTDHWNTVGSGEILL